MEPDRTQWVEQLADRHGRMVLGAAYRVLGDVEAAEDVLQDVFVKLLKGRLGPESTVQWGAYLRVMATRQAIDVIRRNVRRKQQSLDVLADQPDQSAAHPRQEAGRKEMAAIVRCAVQQLPKDEAAIFALRHFEEMTYAEIAVEMRMTANQVGVTLHRGRKKLRKILEPLLKADRLPQARKESEHV